MARQKVEFEGHDGGKLAGLLEYPARAAHAHVLFAHCFSCGKDIAAASRIARALVSRGFAVLRFDFTGLGNSDGDFSNSNFSSNIADLKKAAEFLRSNYKAPSLLLGHSLGGTAALIAAAEIDECKGVATIGAPFDPAHVTKQFEAQLPTIMEKGVAEVDLGGRMISIERQFVNDIRKGLESNVIGSLRKALLVFHSPVDEIVSIAEAEKIYKAAKHPKSFVSLDRADHLLTNKSDAEYVAGIIASWATRYIEDIDIVKPGIGGPNNGEVLVDEHNHEFARAVQTDSHSWLADEPVATGGHDLGPDPYEHLLAALGTCTSMTIRMYANRKKIPLDDVHVLLKHERRYADDCAECEQSTGQIDWIDRQISFKGEMSDDERNRLLEIADKCPVHRTLSNEIRIETVMAGQTAS